MPYNKSNKPDRIKMLPNHAQDIWVSAFNNSIKDNDEESSNKIAWSAIKKAGYKKDDKGIWIKASEKIYYTYKMAETKELPRTIEIMRIGKWKHPVYGLFEITENTMKNIITNFKNKVRGIDISFDLEHGGTSNKSEAVCWVKNLINTGSTLLAEVEWTELGKEKILNKTFRYFSPEFQFIYTDEETGKKFNNVLLGGGLTNKPFIKHMSPVMLSENIDYTDFSSELYLPCEIEKGENDYMNKELLKALKLSENASETDVKVAMDKLIENTIKLSEVKAENETLKAEKITLTSKIDTLEADNAAVTVKLNEAINNKSTADQQIITLNESMKTIQERLIDADWNNVYKIALSEGRMTAAMEETFKAQYIANPEQTKKLIDVLPVVINLNEIGTNQGKNNGTGEDHVKKFNEKSLEYMNQHKVSIEDAMSVIALSEPKLYEDANKQRRGL